MLDGRLFELPDYERTMDVCRCARRTSSKAPGRLAGPALVTSRRGARSSGRGNLVRFEGDDLRGEFANLGFAWELAENRDEVHRLLAETPARRVHLERLNDVEFLTREDAAMGERRPGLSFGFRPLG